MSNPSNEDYESCWHNLLGVSGLHVGHQFLIMDTLPKITNKTPELPVCGCQLAILHPSGKRTEGVVLNLEQYDVRKNKWCGWVVSPCSDWCACACIWGLCGHRMLVFSSLQVLHVVVDHLYVTQRVVMELDKIWKEMRVVAAKVQYIWFKVTMVTCIFVSRHSCDSQTHNKGCRWTNSV